MKATPDPKWYDVIVVGMGPAGASTAYALSQAGVSVLGLEKQTHPRYKVCGGGLSARIEQFLPLDFKTVVEEAVYRLRFTYGGRESYFVESSQPIAYMVMRARFDQWLLNKALQAGTEVLENEPAQKFVPLPDGVEVTTAQGRYRSRIVVGADGAMSLVAQQLFPNRRLRKIPALESEIMAGPSSGNGEMKTAVISLTPAKKGYGWIFPKKEGLSIGVGEFVKGTQRPKKSFQQFAREEPDLAGLQIPPPMGHPLPIFNKHPGANSQGWNGGLVNNRVVLVGDAGHLVDPLLGEGILYAVRSGQLAASSIVACLHDCQKRLEDYETAVVREFGQEFRVASRMGQIIYGLPRSCHRWLGRTFPGPYQHILLRYCEMLQGRETYQTLWAKFIQRLKGPFAA